MASTPSFDLRVPDRPGYSLMEYLAKRDYDVWCMDHEGYERSTKNRKIHAGIKRGAEELLATVKYVRKKAVQKNFSCTEFLPVLFGQPFSRKNIPSSSKDWYSTPSCGPER